MPKIFSGLATGAFLLVAAGADRADAQIKVFWACYIPPTGSVYRIKEPNLRQQCGTGHVEYFWFDGLRALRTNDSAGGDVRGVFSNLRVERLRGRPLSSTAPTAGQVLVFNATEWVPTTLPTGPATAHSTLTGLTADDHPQYLIANGARNALDGFAVTGAINTGSIPASGAGTRLMWYPRRGAFRAGTADGSEWDDPNVGVMSVALGKNTTASGGYSFAHGNGADATGSLAVAFGDATARGDYSTAIGTAGTSASGFISTAIGDYTVASGDFSTAMGYHASTNNQRGSFVYGDASTSTNVQSTLPNQFVVRAAGGFRLRTNSSLTTGCDLPAGSGTFSCTSSRFAKEAFADLNGEDVLAKIARLPIQRWNYRTDSTKARHVGPTAQDFRAAFGLGSSDEAISLVDMDGINMLGVQALVRRTNAQSLEIQRLRAETVAIRARLERENSDLRARLERLEAALQRP